MMQETFKCVDCGQVYLYEDLDKQTTIDLVPYGDTEVPMTTVEYYCPFCGGDDLEEYDEGDDDDDE